MEIIWNGNWHCCWYFTINSLSGKVLVFELWVKMMSAKQIAGFFKICNISRKKWIMKFIFGMQINIEVFCRLILLTFWVCVTRHAQSTQNKKFPYLCNISRKAWGMKLIICRQINAKVFYKVVVSLWFCIARHAQGTQNNKFTVSLQYLKENVKDGVDFLPADKCQRFLQFDTIILGVCDQACPN